MSRAVIIGDVDIVATCSHIPRILGNRESGVGRRLSTLDSPSLPVIRYMLYTQLVGPTYDEASASAFVARILEGLRY